MKEGREKKKKSYFKAAQDTAPTQESWPDAFSWTPFAITHSRGQSPLVGKHQDLKWTKIIPSLCSKEALPCLSQTSWLHGHPSPRTFKPGRVLLPGLSSDVLVDMMQKVSQQLLPCGARSSDSSCHAARMTPACGSPNTLRKRVMSLTKPC